MRILDKDAREYFEGLSDEELKEFADSQELQTEFKLDKLIMDNNWDGRKGFKEEIKGIASRVALLREGKEFLKLPIDKMKETMFAHARKEGNSSTYIKEEQYGLTYHQMYKIITIATVKGKIQGLVNEIPKEELKRKKEEFEDKLSYSDEFDNYDRLSRVEKALLKSFGEKAFKDAGIGIYEECNILMLDIDDAFEEREKELGLSQNDNKSKNKNENKRKGFFARIKDWWKNRHQKQLPPGQENPEEKSEIKENKSHNNDYIDSLHVLPERMNKSNDRQNISQNRENRENDEPSL